MTYFIESAENKLNFFKTPHQNHIPKNPIKAPSVITSENRSDEPMTVQQLNSFHKSDERQGNTAFTPNQPTKNSNAQGVSLFEMFDKCLSSITQNNNDAPQIQTPNLTTQDLEISEINPVTTSPDEMKTKEKTRFDILLEKEQKKKPAQTDKAKQDIPTKKAATRTIYEQRIANIFMLRYFKRWKYTTSVFQAETIQDDFNLIHDKIPGIEGEDTPQTNEDFFLKTKDFSLILNREDIMKDYTQNNLLSTQLSFCDDGDLNEPEEERVIPKPKTATSHPKAEDKTPATKTGKIKEPTKIEDITPKREPVSKDSRKSTHIENRSTNASNTLTKTLQSTPQNSATKRPPGRAPPEKKGTSEKEKLKNVLRSNSHSRIPSGKSQLKNSASKTSTNLSQSINKENSLKTSPMKSTRNYATNK